MVTSGRDLGDSKLRAAKKQMLGAERPGDEKGRRVELQE